MENINEIINNMTDREFKKMNELENNGWEHYYENGRENYKTAFKPLKNFLAKRGITLEQYFDWCDL